MVNTNSAEEIGGFDAFAEFLEARLRAGVGQAVDVADCGARGVEGRDAREEVGVVDVFDERCCQAGSTSDLDVPVGVVSGNVLQVQVASPSPLIQESRRLCPQPGRDSQESIRASHQTSQSLPPRRSTCARGG